MLLKFQLVTRNLQLVTRALLYHKKVQSISVKNDFFIKNVI